VEYFIVFYLLLFNGQEFTPIFLMMEDGKSFKNLEDCFKFGYNQIQLIIDNLNEQGIMYRDLIFKCVEEKNLKI
jgi:hypothetical protein